MSIKDLGQYREGRLDSQVIKTWEDNYKQMVLTNVVFRDANNHGLINQEYLKTVEKNPLCAEIVADTVIGWLNTHVGRCFLRDAFGINIPTVDPNGTE